MPGCPPPAIGSIKIHVPNAYYEAGGNNVETNFENGVLTVWFQVEHSSAQALVVLNVKTERAYATFGSVRRYRNTFCAFPDHPIDG